MEEHGGLPSFVRDEFEAYLQCGRLECGFLELECRRARRPRHLRCRRVGRLARSLLIKCSGARSVCRSSSSSTRARQCSDVRGSLMHGPKLSNAPPEVKEATVQASRDLLARRRCLRAPCARAGVVSMVISKRPGRAGPRFRLRREEWSPCPDPRDPGDSQRAIRTPPPL
jgi:hypothetical protein